MRARSWNRPFRRSYVLAKDRAGSSRWPPSGRRREGEHHDGGDCGAGQLPVTEVEAGRALGGVHRADRHLRHCYRPPAWQGGVDPNSGVKRCTWAAHRHVPALLAGRWTRPSWFSTRSPPPRPPACGTRPGCVCCGLRAIPSDPIVVRADLTPSSAPANQRAAQPGLQRAAPSGETSSPTPGRPAFVPADDSTYAGVGRGEHAGLTAPRQLTPAESQPCSESPTSKRYPNWHSSAGLGRHCGRAGECRLLGELTQVHPARSRSTVEPTPERAGADTS